MSLMNRSSVVLVLALAGSAGLELATSGMIRAGSPPETACAMSPSVAPAVAPAAMACAAVAPPVALELEVVEPASSAARVVELEAAAAQDSEAASSAQRASRAAAAPAMAQAPAQAPTATRLAGDRTPAPRTAGPRPVSAGVPLNAQQAPPEVLQKRRLMLERQANAESLDAGGRLELRKPSPNPETSAKFGMRAGIPQRSSEPLKQKPTWVRPKTRELPVEKLPPPK